MAEAQALHGLLGPVEPPLLLVSGELQALGMRWGTADFGPLLLDGHLFLEYSSTLPIGHEAVS